MSRPTKVIIKQTALLHNVRQIKRYAPHKKIIAMIKANAYGCGLNNIAPTLEGHVDAFGVACLEEAMMLRALGIRTSSVIFQGVFHASELKTISDERFEIVLHQREQLQWLLNTPLSHPIKLWVKVNTGMNRLGLKIDELQEVMEVLTNCPWVDKDIGLMSHLACADEPKRLENVKQMALFNEISVLGFTKRSLANSAAIIALPEAHEDVLRPGIILYGVSPFANQTAHSLNLRPVMHFQSAISAIHHNPPCAKVGYQATWWSEKASTIGIVAAGYGDGYPRHIAPQTPVWIQGKEFPIVGRISMDTLTVDLTDHPEISIGDEVELWGSHILVERIAKSAGTIPYELLCQISRRALGSVDNSSLTLLE